jgi:hypothetical protein
MDGSAGDPSLAPEIATENRDCDFFWEKGERKPGKAPEDRIARQSPSVQE